MSAAEENGNSTNNTIELELRPKLNQTAIVHSFVFNTKTNSVILSLNHAYEWKAVVCPINYVSVTNVGTIKVTIRPGSVSFGEGQGVITNVNGDVATWTSHGLGHLSQGKVIVIGSVVLKTSSTGNLAFLNNMVGVFRQIVDQSNGNVDLEFGS